MSAKTPGDESMATAYERHQLTVEQGTGPVRMWRCAAPDTRNHEFRVVAAPMSLIVYGDSPTDRVLYLPSCRDAEDVIAWLRWAPRSASYMAAKIGGEYDSKFEFSPALVTEMLVSELRESWGDRSVCSGGRACVRGYIDALREWRMRCSGEATVQDAIDCMPEWFEGEEAESWFVPREEVRRTIAALQCFARLCDERGGGR